MLKTGGIVVGILEDAQYQSDVVTMSPGDMMVLYTDGVTEAHDASEEEYGEPRLVETSLAAAHLPAQAIIDIIL